MGLFRKLNVSRETPQEMRYPFGNFRMSIGHLSIKQVKVLFLTWECPISQVASFIVKTVVEYATYLNHVTNTDDSVRVRQVEGKALCQ